MMAIVNKTTNRVPDPFLTISQVVLHGCKFKEFSKVKIGKRGGDEG